MASALNDALVELHQNLAQPCASCGLRFGSCAHTREAEPLLTLIDRLVRVIDQNHQTIGGPQGAHCQSCKDQRGECVTRREVLRILRG